MVSHKKTQPKFGPSRADKFMNTARLEKHEVVETLLPHLKDAANNNAKLLAILGDVGPDTAKNWLEGRNLPGLSTFINMARQSRELRAVAIYLMDPESEYDPDFMRTCMELAQARSRKFDQ